MMMMTMMMMMMMMMIAFETNCYGVLHVNGIMWSVNRSINRYAFLIPLTWFTISLTSSSAIAERPCWRVAQYMAKNGRLELGDSILRTL